MEQLVFLHIPKCAGRSMIDLLGRNYFNILIMNNMQVLLQIPKWELETYDLIAGHMNYQYIKALGFKTMTVVRDPLERTISQYNHFMTMETSALEADVMIKDNYTFIDFVTSSDPNISFWTNMYTSQFGGDGGGVLDIRTFIKRAETSIEEIDFVGIFEQMDETVSRVKDRYHLEGDFNKIGKTPKKNRIAELTKKEKKIAREYLTPDYTLYNKALEMFNA